MSNTRARRARHLLRGASVLWVLLVPLAQLFHPPYLGPRWGAATWYLSSGAIVTLWVGAALWSGTVPFASVGVRTRAISRSQTPAAFWSNVVVAAIVALAAVAYGVYFLVHHV